MTRLTFTVFGKAQPQGSARAFLPRGSKRPVVTSDNPNVKEWRTQVAWEAAAALRAAGGTILTGPVRVMARFALVRPKSLPKKVVHHVKKPDLDKLTRAVGDAITGVLFHDDSQIVQWKVEKVYAADGQAPQAVIVVERLAPTEG